MKVTINLAYSFKKELKRFSKHYSSFINDYQKLLNAITENPNLGSDLGNGIRKIRMQVTSKGKGKRGGMRVISVNVYVSVSETSVTLLFIYDKSERSTIKKQEILTLMKENGLI